MRGQEEEHQSTGFMSRWWYEGEPGRSFSGMMKDNRNCGLLSSLLRPSICSCLMELDKLKRLCPYFGVSDSDVRNVVKPSQWDLPLNTSMLLREVYTCLDVDMRLAGLSCNLLETSSRHGTSELLSITVDQIRVGKTGGRDRSEFSIFHIQVDDLRPQARRPIMFEPMDSGMYVAVHKRWQVI